jgi:cation diffusion facilitator family transporter
MHVHDLRPFAHSHAFGDAGMAHRSRALLQVTWLTLVTMGVELTVGWWSGSLALTADGWHMGTHALALGGAVLAYRLSTKASGRAGFAFGGWKIEVLAAYTSGLALAGAAAWLVIDSIATLRAPHAVAYGEAMAVATIGLAVNLVSAWLLARGERRGHDHAHAHGPHHHQHHDHNFKAAYLHVVADAFTSVLAIVALGGGLWFGLGWLDPVVALLGAAVIARWSFGVIAQSARGLIDATADPALEQRVRDLIEADGDAKIADLHVWQVGTSAWSAVVSIVADRPLATEAYRERLKPVTQLRHVTVEVHPCTSIAD